MLLLVYTSWYVAIHPICKFVLFLDSHASSSNLISSFLLVIIYCFYIESYVSVFCFNSLPLYTYVSNYLLLFWCYFGILFVSWCLFGFLLCLFLCLAQISTHIIIINILKYRKLHEHFWLFIPVSLSLVTSYCSNKFTSNFTVEILDILISCSFLDFKTPRPWPPWVRTLVSCFFSLIASCSWIII